MTIDLNKTLRVESNLLLEWPLKMSLKAFDDATVDDRNPA